MWDINALLRDVAAGVHTPTALTATETLLVRPLVNKGPVVGLVCRCVVPQSLSTAAGAAATYVSATTFTLVGDVASAWAAGSRVEYTVTGTGVVYRGVVYSATYTTVTTVILCAQDKPLVAGAATAIVADQTLDISLYAWDADYCAATTRVFAYASATTFTITETGKDHTLVFPAGKVVVIKAAAGTFKPTTVVSAKYDGTSVTTVTVGAVGVAGDLGVSLGALVATFAQILYKGIYETRGRVNHDYLGAVLTVAGANTPNFGKVIIGLTSETKRFE